MKSNSSLFLVKKIQSFSQKRAIITKIELIYRKNTLLSNVLCLKIPKTFLRIKRVTIKFKQQFELKIVIINIKMH